MTDAQWESLCATVEGRASKPAAGFIIDCPWLPNWYGTTILDYFTDDDIWFAANRAAIDAFPSAIFIPGFWAEYGMCTEPSAFGARCSFPENEFPHAKPTILRVEDIDGLEEPDPSKDGLLPFVLKRMERAKPKMAAIGHSFRFSISRGPLNVATFLMGVTEFLIAMKTEPERTKKLLSVITSFLRKWHARQRELFPTIDGIMVLDDIVGFIGEEDFVEFGKPYLTELFSAPARVKLFHNDAPCEASVAHYPEIGINLYNPGIQTPAAEIYEKVRNKLALLGTVPPRDVLAVAAPEEIAAAVRAQAAALPGGSRLVHSCAGGMPPGVPTANVAAFLEAVAGLR
jgi:uroporphyrinogen-III decarboxylase